MTASQKAIRNSKAVMLIVYRAHGGVCQQVVVTMQPIDGQ
jgi:hypothetical protein